MIRPIKQFIAFAALAVAMALPALAGDELKPRDLTPVTWLDTPSHPPVGIVSNGQPRAVVYLADPRATEKFDPKKQRGFSSELPRLVQELVEVIRLSTGATLELVEQPPPADQPAIVIGDCDQTRKDGIDATKIPVEGFVVKTAPNRVYLVGSTQKLPPGSQSWAKWANEGTAWAVADFLERFVGVRWYWPTEVGGRTITRSSTLVVPGVHYRDQPVFRQREYHPAFGWTIPTKARSSDKEPLPFASGVIPDGLQVVNMASYLPLVRSGCSWPYKIKVHEPQDLGRRPKEFHDAHQEMFAVKKDGTRNFSALCYSSQKALDFLLEGCERVWDKGGTATWVTPTCVTLSPGDTAVTCQCPDCQATYAKGGGDWINGTSLIMSLFAKRMCEAVKQRWPDKKVIYLPYWNYDECPREVDYPDNLVVMSAMTTYPMPLSAQPANFQEAVDRSRAWRSKACLPITTWDYCIVAGYGPYQYPHVVRDFYQAVRDICAGTFINGENMGEWTTTAPTLYVWMKVLWNPDLDVDAALDEMCRRLYGKAGGNAREFMRLQCDIWEKGPWMNQRVKSRGGWPVPRSLFPRVFTPDVVARLKTLRDKALVELADDPVGRQRFLYWTWAFDAFLKEAEGLEQQKTP
jgi:hypothetical protein